MIWFFHIWIYERNFKCSGCIRRQEFWTQFQIVFCFLSFPPLCGHVVLMLLFFWHLLQERFYFSDHVLPCFETGIPLLKQRLQQLPDSDKASILAFPRNLSFLQGFLPCLVLLFFPLSNSLHIHYHSSNSCFRSDSSRFSRRWSLEALPQATGSLSHGWYWFCPRCPCALIPFLSYIWCLALANGRWFVQKFGKAINE